MKKIKLLVKNLGYCSKNHANSQDGTRMNPNFTPKCFYWYVVFQKYKPCLHTTDFDTFDQFEQGEQQLKQNMAICKTDK